MALTLKEFRVNYPQYDNVEDEPLARALHKKYYSDRDWDDFSSQIGYAPDVDAQAQPEPIPTPQEEPAQDPFDSIESEQGYAAEQAVTPDPVVGGGGDLSMFPERGEKQAGQSAMARRLVEIGYAEPERYKFTDEEWDAQFEDRIQKVLAQPEVTAEEAQKNIADTLGARTGFEPSAPEDQVTEGPGREISEDAGNWKYLKENLKALPKLISAGATAVSTMHDRVAAENLKFGQIYYERIVADYEGEEVSDKALQIAEDAAAKHDMTLDEYAKFTANAVDVAWEAEWMPLQEYKQILTEVQKFKPKSADDTFIGHIAALAIENVQNLGYIAAGVVTFNPITTMALMGTDIYARTYASARLEGRSYQEASMDAFASTTIEAVTEGVPVYKFIQLMKAGKTSRAMKLLQGVGTETGQEILAEAGQIAYDTGIVGKDITFGEMWRQLRDAGILGGLMGAAIGGPVAAFGDNDMQNANDRINRAKKDLQSVANRVLDPSNRGTDATRAEAEAATKEYTEAMRERAAIVEQRKEAEKEKKAAKAEKKEGKRVAKLTPKQKKREAAVKEQVEADQAVIGGLTEDDLRIAEAIEKAGNREYEDIDRKDIEELLDLGYAKISKSKELVVLPGGQRRLKAVRAAQETGEVVLEEEGPIEIVPYVTEATKQRAAERDAEIGRLIRDEAVIEPEPYTSPENRQAKIEARVRESITAPAVRDKIVKAIVKAEDEEAAFAEQEARVAEKIERNMNAGYEQALKDQNAVEAEVALNLAKMDQRNRTAKPSRLGDVFRAAEKRLKEEADKARAAMDDAFWSKPVQGQLFDVTGVLVKGSAEYAKAVKVGAFKLAQHGAKYSAWAADMVSEFGESIKPVLTKIYHDAKQNVKNVLKWSHEKHTKGPKRGELKFAPKAYAFPGAIAQLRRVLAKLAKEGASAKHWYEKSGKAILKATGNVKEARQLAGLLAIYSTGTGVGPNLTNALKMWAILKAGKKVLGEKTQAGRFTRQDREAREWLSGEVSDEEFYGASGPKVFAFYTNLMREIDPKTYEFGQGVTVDIWMMRALGYDTSAPTDAQYAFAAVELRQLAEKLGWERQQVQAAVWVAIKSRWALIQKRSETRAVKEGLADFVTVKKPGAKNIDVVGETRKDQIENEKKITMIYRDEALKASVGELEASLERSKKDFSDFLEKQYATISWEADPSTSLGLVFNSMPIEDKILLQYEIAQIFTNPETGREYLAEWLGLIGADQFNGPGVWDGAVTAATQNKVLSPQKHKTAHLSEMLEVQPESKTALDGYAAIIGFLIKQDAVAWHRPFLGKALKRANGIGLIMPENMDPAELSRRVTKLYSYIVSTAQEHGYSEQTGLDWAPIVLDGEIRVLNFTEIPNREFHKLIREAADRANVGGAMETFQTDGTMVSNDWVENPNGEQYEQEINNSENPRVEKAFGRAKDKFTKRIAAVYEKYAEKYKAQREPTVTVTMIDGSRQERVQKLPALKKGFMRFRTFRKNIHKALKVEFAGKGLRGAEQKRRAMQVISAYPDKGFKKEVGLGNIEYVIDIKKEDLYDANNDPLRLKEKAGKDADWFTKYERLIKAAGFAGFYTPDAKGNLKGQARFFYDLTVGEGATTATSFVPARPVVQIKENTLDHFEVRDPSGKIFEIEDPDEAIKKARSIYGNAVVEIVDENGDVIVRDQPVEKEEKLTYTTLEMSTGIPVLILKKANVLADIQRSMDDFFAEWEEETTQNPLNPESRVVEGGAAVELMQYSNAILIRSLYSFEIGEGAGNAALKFIIELADRHGVTLELTATPFETEAIDTMDQRALIEWYMRNGFARKPRGRRVLTETERPLFMDLVREPRNATAVKNEFMRIKRPTTPTNAFFGPERDHVESVVFRFQQELELDETAFEIVNSVEELPDELYDQIAIAGAAAGVQGAFHEDPITGPTVYLIVNNIRALPATQFPFETDLGMEAAIQQLILHETIGHFGLQALLGPKKYNQYMDQIRRAFPEEVKKRGEKILRGTQGRRLAAEEVFAYMVQDELLGVDLSKTKTSLIDKVIAEIRLLFMRLGWAKMNRNDMLNMMWRSAEFVAKHDVAFLKKRASTVKSMKKAAFAIERAHETWQREHAASFSLVQEREADPDLDAFMDKMGNKKGQRFAGLREMWDRFTDNLKNRAEIETLDQFAGILHAEEELGMDFGPTSGYMSVRISAGIDVMVRSAMENSVPTWDAEGSVAMDNNSKGLLEILAPIAQSEEMLTLFEGFIVARRAKRLKGEDRERLFSSEEIAAMEKQVKKLGYVEIFEEVAAEMAEYKGRVLDFAEEAGLINPEERKLWEHHDHVPFYRVLTEDKTGPYANARMGNVGQQIHRLEGGEETLRNPLANIVENLSVLIEASVKNRAMSDVIKNFMGTGVVTKAPRAKVTPELVPMGQIRDMLNEHGVALDAVGNELLSGVQQLMTLQAVTGDNVVSVQENGRREYYYVHDTGVMRGMDNIRPDNWGWLMKALRYPKRIFTLVITRMPPFILKNWFRDMLHTFILSRHGTIAPVYDSLRGWAKAIVEDPTYKDILSGGGMFDSGYVNASDPRTTQRAIRKQLIERGGASVLDTPRKLARFYMRLANGAENAHRIVVYQKALKKTGSRKQALFESRDIMDFAVRGAHPVIRFLAETVPFWGARVQGISRTYKGKENPVTLAMRALPVVLASIALYLWNRDDDRYKSLNPYEQRAYYHFYDVFEKGDHFRLPKPFEVGAIFSTIPEIMVELMLSKEPDKGAEAANALFWVLREQFGLSPSIQAAAPIFELMINENLFTEAPILTEYEKRLPPKEQAGIRTSKVITRLARSMPEGAPEFMQSPKQLEHLLKGYFASAYEYGVGAADMLYNTLSDGPNKAPTVRWDEALFVNAFVREPYGKYDKYQEVMYDVLEAANKIHNAINLNEKLGTDEADKRIEFLEERYESLLYAREEMTTARKSIQKVNETIRQVYADDGMSPTEKREEIDELLEERREIAKEIWDYRPGGKENPYKKSLEKMMDDLIGMNKREQVDALLQAQLPHTATLINDITISDDKLREAA